MTDWDQMVDDMGPKVCAAIKVVPGEMTPEEALAGTNLLAVKVCAGCGVRLDIWSKMPVDYHSLGCPYKHRLLERYQAENAARQAAERPKRWWQVWSRS